VIAPLDRIKILFQTGNPQFKQYSGSVKGTVRGLGHIWRTSGIYGLYQGHSVTLLRVFPYAAIKFVAYDQIRDHFIPTKEHEIWYRRIAAGSLAGTVIELPPSDIPRFDISVLHISSRSYTGKIGFRNTSYRKNNSSYHLLSNIS
jgi:solute carrier family 25 protein 16